MIEIIKVDCYIQFKYIVMTLREGNKGLVKVPIVI